MTARAPVCLLAIQTSDALFGSTDTLGRVVRIAGRAFTVVGIFTDGSGDHQYRQAMVGERAEVYLPITTARRIPQLNGVRKIIVEADDQAGAARQIDAFMRERLRAKPDAVFASCAATMKQAALRSRQRVSLFIALAGFLALLVAGIGVANLLFVSVAERAAEIGLRRSLGASAFAIAWHFVAESVILCLMGALVGIAAAFLLTSGFFSVAFPDTVGGRTSIFDASLSDLATIQLPAAQPEVAWSAVLIAALIAVLAGVLAGVQPALAAARLTPAEAIRASPAPRHQLARSLTVLQLSVGVAAVLLLISFYEGRARTELAALQEGRGAGQIWLQFGSPMEDGTLNNDVPSIRAGLGEIAKLLQDPSQFRRLRHDLSLFSHFDPRIEVGATVRAGATPLRVEGGVPVVCGTVPGALATDVESARAADMLPEGAGPMMAAGAFFSDQDTDEARRVAVLPHEAAAALFGSRDPVGQPLVIGGRPFTVSGVLAPWVSVDDSLLPRLSSGAFPVLIPATTLVTELPGYEDNWWGVQVRVKDALQGPAAIRQLEDQLRPRLRLPRNVFLFPRGSLADAVDVANRQRWAELRAGAGGLAALLIAIIGLVNMLLVSIHESVREVGLRRALGALRTQVGWQFLREGALLAIAGALSGTLLGVLSARWLGAIVDVPVHIPVGWALGSGLAAVLAASAASLGPAIQAARIPPVEALRYE